MHYITLNLLNSKKLSKNLNGLTLNEIMKGIKLNLLLYMLYYVKAHEKLAGPITASLHRSNIAAFKEMLQRYKAAGNAVFKLTKLI